MLYWLSTLLRSLPNTWLALLIRASISLSEVPLIMSLMPKLKDTLEKLTNQGIVSKVQKAIDWVNSLVIVEEKNGSLRLCLDPKELNKAIKREHYKPPTAEKLSSKLNGKRVFTVILT